MRIGQYRPDFLKSGTHIKTDIAAEFCLCFPCDSVREKIGLVRMADDPCIRANLFIFVCAPAHSFRQISVLATPRPYLIL
jgi:hypothetical protein